MKFLIITKYGRYVVEAEDIEDAVKQAYDSNAGYSNIQAVVNIDEE